MISIVVPAYNAAGVIGRCIDTVLRQTYPDFELLIIDDGSTDKTAEIAAEPTLLTIMVSAVPIKEESSCSTIIGISSFRKSKLLYKCCVLSCINEILFSYFQIYFSTIFFNGKGSIRLMIALPGVRCGVSYNFAT